ncbi:endospore germination permease [Paenibacillus oryzisoli]|uniref:GerAB/ArcD/ProY family transporter n=1 Tax=Paenibacillus oryzisoli TaxID=1850517 RepID=UPI003D26A04C
MYQKEQINSFQMTLLFFAFMTGSSIVNIPGPLIGFARNGAWLSLLIAMCSGLLMLTGVLYLYKRFPELTLIEYSRKLVGNVITSIIAVAFVSFQWHITSGIVLDIGLFMTSSMMRQTPLYLFLFFVYIVAALSVRSGIETIARMLLVPFVIVIFFIVLTLILSINNYDVNHLLPVMPEGVKPILLGGYFAYGFPYTELILMSMLLPYVRSDERSLVGKRMYISLLLNGFFLLAVTLCTILVFGPMAGERKYSMFEVARIINMLEVIQRIESIIGISLITTALMKATITLYILNLTLTNLFKLSDNRILVYPLALTCFLFSLMQIRKGAAFWVNSVSVLHGLWGTFAAVLPLLFLIAVALMRRKQS